MIRERALKGTLVVVGLLFTAGIYPVTMILWKRDQSSYADAMMGTLYITLAVLLLMAVRNPSEHRSLIAFAAWSSVAHAAVMAIMAFQNTSERELLWGVAALAVIGTVLAILAPAKVRAGAW
jgi:hydrogenase-4 membrane subunit HyfE